MSFEFNDQNIFMMQCFNKLCLPQLNVLGVSYGGYFLCSILLSKDKFLLDKLGLVNFCRSLSNCAISINKQLNSNLIAIIHIQVSHLKFINSYIDVVN